MPWDQQRCEATPRPVSRFFHRIPFFLGSFFAATGCTAMSDANQPGSDVFRPMQSVSEAKAQLAAWITPSTAIADAVQKLTASGFSCKETMPRSPDTLSSVYCSYQIPPPRVRVAPWIPDIWNVALDSRNGYTVSNFQVSRSSAYPQK